VTPPEPDTSSPGAAPGTPPAPLALEHCFQASIGSTKKWLGMFLEISGLGAQYETYEYAEGGNNLYTHHFIGRRRWPNITLKSGVTNQDALLDWVLDTATSGARENLTVEFMLPDFEQPLRTYTFVAAIPIRWTGPNANIAANAVATESLEIVHHGLSVT